MQLSELWIYPIKSAQGISVKDSAITPTGLQYDRRWMLVNNEGHFLTQRELPQMAQLEIEIIPEGLLCAFGKSRCDIPFLAPLPNVNPKNIDQKEVTVWRSTVMAWGYSKQINAWFSHHLKTDCELVYMPDITHRATNPVYAPEGQVGFADGYPFLVTTTASLEALNQQLLNTTDNKSVNMARFRPNLVIQNKIPFEEEHWKQIKVGNAIFEIVKPCERCVIINTDQQTGERYKEPLKTLAAYRKQLNLPETKVVFGQNALCTTAAPLQRHMPVTLISKRL